MKRLRWRSKPLIALKLLIVANILVLFLVLFLIMITDIDNEVKYSHLSSFADDTRVLKEINGLIDTFKMQGDLNTVYK